VKTGGENGWKGCGKNSWGEQWIVAQEKERRQGSEKVKEE
jgi:hypothetical protein